MSAGDILALLLTWTPFLALGFLWNILISLVSMAIGTPLGFGLARLRLSGSRIGAGLTAAARLPPTFVLIYYLAYVLPTEIVISGYSLGLPGWLKASLALSVAVAGFVSDNALSALRHHKRGERVEALYFIPAWTTYFLIIVMASSTASVIGVPEIVQRANTVIAAVGEPSATLWVYLYAMLWFLGFCWPLARLMSHIRARLGRRAGSQAGRQVPLADRGGFAELNLIILPDGELPMAADIILEKRFDIAPELASIATIQAEIEAAAEDILPPGAVFKLTMAVEELVTNAVLHGGCGNQPIGIGILVDPRCVTVELSDAGTAFDPFREAPPPDLDAALEDRQIGGLGIHLVGRMVDRAYYHRIGERNHVRLVMLRPGVASDGITP
ncbi:MAG: ATP-binding protein [Zavarzinia sp.]|nr:ATP-binding protein [Zavarzinia sp.]